MPARKRVREEPFSHRKSKIGGKREDDDGSIDDLTKEPLHPLKKIAFTGPDGSFVLNYNTSTLVKVAEYNGQFMQPPHFKEPMSAELIAEVEKLEGKSFAFSDSLKHILDGTEVFTHQLARFDDMMERYYILSSQDIFVCPLCYEHYLWTRYAPSLSQKERKKLETYSQTEVLPLDPLDVLDHMKSHVIDDVAETFSPLLCIAFTQGKGWKQHMSIHHNLRSTSVRDHRLRDLLCTYFSAYNREKRDKEQKTRKAGGAPPENPFLTQQRYWAKDACYNKLRYNRLIDFIEANSKDLSSILAQNAFPEEKLQEQYDIEDDHSNCSDFINDDDSSCSLEYDGPHYSLSFSTEKSGSSSQSSTASSNSHSSQNSFDKECTISSKQNVRYDALKHQWVLKKHSVSQKRHLFPEEESFLQEASEKKVLSTSLYDPSMHKIETNDSEKIDFEHIGEDIPIITTIIKSKDCPKAKQILQPCETNPQNFSHSAKLPEAVHQLALLPEPLPRVSAKLLLDDD